MDELSEVIQCATSQIGCEYFQLKVKDKNGKKKVIFRERVYCYELYHQLKNHWPKDTPGLYGEIAKGGLPILGDPKECPDLLAHVPGESSTKKCPDLLVHVPSESSNHAIIEVKPAKFRKRYLKKDFETVSKFMKDFGYKRGICLIYGDTPKLINRIQTEVDEFVKSGNDASRIEIWHHSKVGFSAKHIEISGTKKP